MDTSPSSDQIMVLIERLVLAAGTLMEHGATRAAAPLPRDPLEVCAALDDLVQTGQAVAETGHVAQALARGLGVQSS